MIIEKNTLEFFRVAKLLCNGKKSGVDDVSDGVFYNGEKFIAASRNFQVVFYTGENKLSIPLVLPMTALTFIASFKVGSKVDFELVDSKVVKIKCGRSRAAFPLMGFTLPKPVNEDSSKTIAVKSEDVSLVKIGSCAANSESSGSIRTQGVMIETIDGKLAVYSTDGFRMAYTTTDLSSEDSEKGFSAKMQKDMLNKLVSSSLLKDDDIVYFSISDDNRKLVIRNSVLYVSCLMFDFQAFDADGFIKPLEEESKSLYFEKAEMLELIKRISILTADMESTVVLKINSDSLSICMESSVSMFEESITIKNDSNIELEIGFTLKYLLDAISCLHSENIEMMVSGDKKPALFFGESKNIKYLLMPRIFKAE